MYDTVLDALRRGAADESLSAARELSDARPDDIVAARLLAAAQRLGGDSGAALATLDAALERAPEDADLHLERAGLLLQARELDAAQAALARSIGLDPNQFPAYILQAQLALGRGQLDEAQRLARTAARIAPDHPQVSAVEGMVALRQGRIDEALSILSQASETAPDEPTLRNALGFAYLEKGHYAFAEQVFRAGLKGAGDNVPQRALIADIVRQQGRPGDAADELRPLLDDPASQPSLHRLAGELELEAGRTDAAIPRLKHALARMPADRRTLSALMTAWQQLDDRDDARNTLDAALATHADAEDLWLARLGVESFATPEALAVIDRWLAAKPDHVPALVARATALDTSGDADGAEAAAARIVELEPGHAQAELRLLAGLSQRDPEAAFARLAALAAQAPDPQVQRALRQMLGRAYDQAGRFDDAVATWQALHSEVAGEREIPPAATGFEGPWPDPAALPENAPGVLLLWGAPGSLVEQVAAVFQAGNAPLLADRFTDAAPADPLQRFDTPARLVAGDIDPAYLAAQWRAGLPARGVAQGRVFDWLGHWDNALGLALRAHLPEASLMVVLRDPRDMLLDWLAYGSPLTIRFESPVAAAGWLAAMLDQVAELDAQTLVTHAIVRLDGIESNPEGIAQAISNVLGVDVPVPDPQLLGAARLPSGHWRRFVPVLGEAFELLAPVARRLGYSD